MLFCILRLAFKTISMPTFNIRHTTKYSYEVPVKESANQIILYPKVDNFQELIYQKIQINGNPTISTHEDYYHNTVGTFTQIEAHSELIIDSWIVVRTHPKTYNLVLEPISVQWDVYNSIQNQLPYLDFLRNEPVLAREEILESISGIDKTGISPMDYAQRLNSFIFENFNYLPGITNVETTLDEAWKIKAGVCQDFAHLLCAILRFQGIPSRYISGYICPNKNGMRGEGATHAWAEAFIPFIGWVGLDPTNNCLVNDSHVRLAMGRNFSDCSPVKGTYRGTAKHNLEVSVSVEYEDSTPHNPKESWHLPEETASYSVNSYQRNKIDQEMQQQ